MPHTECLDEFTLAELVCSVLVLCSALLKVLKCMDGSSLLAKVKSAIAGLGLG